MSIAIVDASVAVKWVLRESDSDIARTIAAGDMRLLAPDLIILELANALRKAVSAQSITRDYAVQSLAGIRRVFDPLITIADFIDEAISLAIDLKHPIYDCVYLVTSRRLGAPLVTADTTFAAKLAGTPDAANVILLADWKT